MDPGAAPVPQCLPGKGALAAEHPTLGSRIWVDWERLLGVMVFFAQLAQTEATQRVPRALDACDCPPRAPRFNGFVPYFKAVGDTVNAFFRGERDKAATITAIVDGYAAAEAGRAIEA